MELREQVAALTSALEASREAAALEAKRSKLARAHAERTWERQLAKARGKERGFAKQPRGFAKQTSQAKQAAKKAAKEAAKEAAIKGSGAAAASHKAHRHLGKWHQKTAARGGHKKPDQHQKARWASTDKAWHKKPVAARNRSN